MSVAELVWRPEYRSIVVIDMAGSGRWDDCAQLRSREALDVLVRAALRNAGIEWGELVAEDRGDGMILLVPPNVSKVDLLGPLVPALAAGLREYNSVVGEKLRIRLRAAIHAGEVLRGPSGWVGTDMYLACRLVNSAPLYQELVRSPEADLVVAVSQAMHDAVVRHGYPGIDQAAYSPVRVVAKEVETTAWLHVPGPAVAPPGREGVTVAVPREWNYRVH
jgi:class 3 adenylate cyclase